MLRKITFTGIDKHTDVNQLCELARDYPKVEFGFLIFDQKREQEETRCDPLILQDYRGAGLSLSLHVCGGLKRRLTHIGDWSEIRSFMQGYFSLFGRVQLNGCGKNLHWNLTVPPEISEVIIQQPSASNMPFYQKYLDNQAKIPGNFTVLFDASSGRGQYTETFETANLPYAGYAGGLGPDNVRKAVLALESDEAVQSYWIDMQTGVRDANDRFSALLCRKVCEELGEYAL